MKRCLQQNWWPQMTSCCHRSRNQASLSPVSLWTGQRCSPIFTDCGSSALPTWLPVFPAVSRKAHSLLCCSQEAPDQGPRALGCPCSPASQPATWSATFPWLLTELCTNPPHTVMSQACFPTPTPACFLAPSPVTFLMPLLASGAGSCLPSISTSPFLCQLSIKPAHWSNLPTYPAPKSNPRCTEVPGSEARSRLLAVRQGQLWTSCTQVMGARSHCVQCWCPALMLRKCRVWN